MLSVAVAARALVVSFRFVPFRSAPFGLFRFAPFRFLFRLALALAPLEKAWIERVAEIPVDGSNHRPDVCLIEVRGCDSRYCSYYCYYYYFL